MEFLPKILVISLGAGVLAQFIKILIKSNRLGKFKLSYLDDYGGMPSSHAAFLFALMTGIILKEGFLSTEFAITFVISAILIRDALGIRMELEKQGKYIKEIVEKQSLSGIIEANGSVGDRIGHTYPEIVVGSLLGITFAFVLYNLL